MSEPTGNAPFKTQRLVEFHDTDMAGIMHFASFFHYMESAEHEMIRSLGFSVHTEHEGQKLSFPRVSVSCDFHSPARSEDILDIAIRVTKIGTSSVSYDFRFTCEGREVATGAITAVCCSVTPGEPIAAVPLPSDIVEKLKTYAA
ncbi:acyl-CoA thioesterase [Adhaeretor mobilis]|uniref:1,4-dihydroxy-2-naphthoyl-CoA hydrolase n=1 Tax=Adhaeretor mobilis TaxID=1930276 RepID=A0A517N1Z4_9BACT|nr:thioesterase family protein [Adhaeretor mobilis]QDT01159.1 1,4-dihydroxy-2-naphthoyl-CoA hydrolase [Adhaeretor mobilis]